MTQLAASYGLALVTNLPVNSVAELVALAKSKPGKLTYATNGVGNITHVAGLLFEARTGTQMVAVPYNTPNLTTDVMTGTVDLTFYSIAAAGPLVYGGKLKALAVTGSRRSPDAAEHADAAGARLQGFRHHRLVRSAVPGRHAAGPHRAHLQGITKALDAPEVTRVINAAGMYAVGSSPAEFAAFLQHDYDYQGKLMTELGLKAK